jgi:hypothetical protein
MTDGKSKTDIYESSRCPNEKYLLEMLKKKKNSDNPILTKKL